MTESGPDQFSNAMVKNEMRNTNSVSVIALALVMGCGLMRPDDQSGAARDSSGKASIKCTENTIVFLDKEGNERASLVFEGAPDKGAYLNLISQKRSLRLVAGVEGAGLRLLGWKNSSADFILAAAGSESGPGAVPEGKLPADIPRFRFTCTDQTHMHGWIDHDGRAEFAIMSGDPSKPKKMRRMSLRTAMGTGPSLRMEHGDRQTEFTLK